MRHRADANAPELYQEARKMGFKLYVNNDALCDTIAQLCGITELWEVKQKAGKFTPLQEKMREAGWIIRTVRSVDDLVLARSEMTRNAAAMQKARMG